MYGYLGSMVCKPGTRDAVVEILLSGVEGLRSVGCDQYTVAVALDDDVTIHTSEVWGSKQEHDDSLQLPETRAAISSAMPMLTGEFTSVETEVRGGLGLDQHEG